MYAVELFEEMASKWGFSDGNNVPVYAGEARAMMVKALKRLLPPELGVEPYEYDRPGLHNWCLLLWRDKGAAGNKDSVGPEWDRPCPPEAHAVLELLDDVEYLDTCVAVEVVVKEDEATTLLEELATSARLAETGDYDDDDCDNGDYDDDECEDYDDDYDDDEYDDDEYEDEEREDEECL